MSLSKILDEVRHDALLAGVARKVHNKRLLKLIGRYLTRKLKLVVNHQKSRVCRTDGVAFLGYQFSG